MIEGIHAATITPLDKSGDIDPKQLKSMLAFLSVQPDLTGFLINGHAGEGDSLTIEEQITNLRYYVQEFSNFHFFTCGVSCRDSVTAIENIKALQRSGAHAVLVFPPPEIDPNLNKQEYVSYFRRVCAKSVLPVILYRPSYFSGQAPSLSTMTELMRLDNVVALKDGSWDVVEFEKLKNVASGLKKPFDVLGSSDEHFFYNYLSGNVGCQASLVTLLPEKIVKLIKLTIARDIDKALVVHADLAPLAHYIYRNGAPIDMVIRLKMGLVVRGIIDNPMPKSQGHFGLSSVRKKMTALLREHFDDLTSAAPGTSLR